MPFLKKRTPLEKEWRALLRQEAALARAAGKAAQPWREELESRIPGKVLAGLRSAFCKAFQVLFLHSTALLEKTYDSDALRDQHSAADREAIATGSRKALRQPERNGRLTRLSNMAITTAEGVGLGALGIGMPDIVLFLGMVLRGIYETALQYGYDYDSPGERLLILSMMEASLARGQDWESRNEEVEALLKTPCIPDETVLQEQLRRTGEAFAVDMLAVKFLQGLPLVGILGGAANPIYYHKVLRYVQLKYRKRYLRSVARRMGVTLEKA